MDELQREIEIRGNRIAFLLRRSGRARQIRAEIHLHRGLRVTLPHGMEEHEALAFLHSRGTWILRTLRRFERLASVIPERALTDGARLPYLGRELTLRVSRGPVDVALTSDVLWVQVPVRREGTVRRALQSWYFRQACAVFEERASALAARIGIRPVRIRVREMKSRWGSCTRAGVLTFNWCLILAPLGVVDYLIAHELAHLKVPNHSPAFWTACEEIYPGYQVARRWLRRFGASLVI
ncbi:MAG: M48 family metallopeptidase [Acidobacteria bacterium]|nr:M48 family metallopeptidase [Acidobacteriota bacterium]